MDILDKILRMHFRDHIAVREIAKRTGLSRNTVRAWLQQPAPFVPLQFAAAEAFQCGWSCDKKYVDSRPYR